MRLVSRCAEAVRRLLQAQGLECTASMSRGLQETTPWGIGKPRLVGRHVEVQSGTAGMRPEEHGVHFRRAVARWSPGLDWDCRISEGLFTLGTWLRQSTTICPQCPWKWGGVGGVVCGGGGTGQTQLKGTRKEKTPSPPAS